MTKFFRGPPPAGGVKPRRSPEPPCSWPLALRTSSPVLRFGLTAVMRSDDTLRRRKVRGENLHRHCAVEPRVEGTIDLSHPTRAQLRLDFVGAQFAANGESRRCAQL